MIERLCSVDLCEAYSFPRVGDGASQFGGNAGEAMDVTTGWGFNREEDRQRAEIYVGEVKPLATIGSPPCVAFSQLQTLIPDSDNKREQLAEVISHMSSL